MWVGLFFVFSSFNTSLHITLKYFLNKSRIISVMARSQREPKIFCFSFSCHIMIQCVGPHSSALSACHLLKDQLQSTLCRTCYFLPTYLLSFLLIVFKSSFKLLLSFHNPFHRALIFMHYKTLLLSTTQIDFTSYSNCSQAHINKTVGEILTGTSRLPKREKVVPSTRINKTARNSKTHRLPKYSLLQS